jgi:hypothetical protein
MSKFLSPIDLNKNELQNARIQNLATAPATPVLGQIYFDTTNNTSYEWNGTIWWPWNTSKAPASSIPLSVLAVNPLARANHTGTQLAATVSDLATTVKSYSLDQFAVPVAAVSWNGKAINNLLDPVAAQDAATKNYVDGAVQSAAAGIDSKASVRVIATANLTLSAPQTIDGVAVVAGDRVLATGQTSASQNGVYVVAAGAWTRALDADQTGEITPGAFWFVEEGTTYGKTQWRCNNTGVITVNTTAITIVQFGAAANYTASLGVKFVANDIELNIKAAGGLVADATGLYVDRTLVPNKFAVTFGDGSATSYTLTHNLGTLDATVTLRDVASGAVVYADVTMATINTVTVAFGAAPAANSLRAVIVG